MSLAPLRYLDFDTTEDELGHVSFDALAAAAPAQLDALQAEVARVLDWAHARFGAPAALDDGGQWDCELQGVRETASPLEVLHRPGEGLQLRAGAPGEPRVTLSLTLTGTRAFCDALREAFALE